MIECLSVMLGPKLRMLTIAVFRVRVNGSFFFSVERAYVSPGLSCFPARPYLATEKKVNWRMHAQIKQLAWPMVERQIGHRKSSLVLSARFPFVKWRSRAVAKSA